MVVGRGGESRICIILCTGLLHVFGNVAKVAEKSLRSQVYPKCLSNEDMTKHNFKK